MKPWSKSRRNRCLKFAAWLDRWAARIRAQVKARTPKRRVVVGGSET